MDDGTLDYRMFEYHLCGSMIFDDVRVRPSVWSRWPDRPTWSPGCSSSKEASINNKFFLSLDLFWNGLIPAHALVDNYQLCFSTGTRSGLKGPSHSHMKAWGITGKQKIPPQCPDDILLHGSTYEAAIQDMSWIAGIWEALFVVSFGRNHTERRLLMNSSVPKNSVNLQSIPHCNN